MSVQILTSINSSTSFDNHIQTNTNQQQRPEIKHGIDRKLAQISGIVENGGDYSPKNTAKNFTLNQLSKGDKDKNKFPTDEVFR